MNNGTRLCFGLLGLLAPVCSVGCTIQQITDAGDASTTNGKDASGGSDETADATAMTDPGADAGANGDDGATTVDASGSATLGDGGTVVTSDPCGTTETANDDPAHATPYALGTDFHACLQVASDIDYYEITTPATPLQGGVVVVQVKDLTMSGNVDLAALGESFSNGTGGPIATVSSYIQGNGESLWFSAAPATSYLIRVKPFSLASESPYTLRVDFTGVPDLNEPNDTRATATPITVGTPIHGYFFSASISNNQSVPWDDFFKVTLPAGNTTIALTDIPSDANGQLFVYDSSDSGTALLNPYGITNGNDVSATRSLAAGDYTIDVVTFSGVGTNGSGATPANYTTKPYTLTVTQQ